ncbi:MAG: hypothetical protein CMO80_22985 [Verrucomicrobiales bacterium]|nr:hypothetical protein [Verrucomicrobiales bacterium]|tara:strand:- start:3528 stop:4541 length:1014 start_codon:yes stop_codon:yes gene_type:complete
MKNTFFSSLPIIALLAGCGGEKSATNAPPVSAWPEKAISISVQGPAGTATDAFVRAVAKAMGTELGVNVAVENVGTPLDGMAAKKVSEAAHDGYQWVGVSETMFTAPWRGVTESKLSDWNFFFIAEFPAVISVTPAQRLTKIQTLIRESKKEDAELRVAASAAGSIWHAKLNSLEKVTDTKFVFKQFGGAGPSQLATMAGQADAVISSLGDQAKLIKTKKLVPLAIIGGHSASLEGHGEIPAASDLYPALENDGLRKLAGFALPGDVPEDAVNIIATALQNALATPEVKALAANHSAILLGTHGTPANQEAAKAAEVRASLAEEIKKSTEVPDLEQQ